MTALSPASTLSQDVRTVKRLELNYKRNAQQDHTALLDDAAGRFDYATCKDVAWNPERFSLLWGTPF